MLSTKIKKGFTLLELVVVIVILGILAAIAIPSYTAVIGKSQQQSATTSAQALAREVAALGAFDGNPAVTAVDLDAAWADVAVSANNVHVAASTTATFTVGTKTATYTITSGVGVVTP